MQDLQHPTNAPAVANPPLRIAGFGACMIAGWPHPAGGLFEVACKRIEATLKRSIESRITSLGSFPASRAEKHLKRRALDFKPDYVVIQFGATDAQCPIRRQSSRSSNSAGNAREAFHAATALTVARWEIASLINFLLKTQARTPLSAYIEAIGRMADDCILDGATPIVLSPFVFGSRYSTRNAVLFTKALHELQSQKQPMILVNCVRLLSNFPRLEVLLSDGFHLSRMAHNLVGEAVGDIIAADVVRTHRSSPSPTATCPTRLQTRVGG